MEDFREGGIVQSKLDGSRIGDDFSYTRYSSLCSLWAHHNTIQLQLPTIILTASVLVISNIILKAPSNVFNPDKWGVDPAARFGVGIPLLVTGLAIAGMLYTMQRTRSIMKSLEKQLDLIENRLGDEDEDRFSDVNHPPGPSGPVLMRNFMLLCFAFPATVFGLFLIFGLKIILAVSLAPCLACLIRKRTKSLRHRGRLKRRWNLALLSPDVAAAFPTDQTVNDALRSLMASRNEESLSKTAP